MRKIWLWLLATLFFLALASHFSGFELKSSNQQLSWSIALMLTPFGLITNLLLENNPELYPFYFKLSLRSGLFDNPLLILMLVLTWILAFKGLYEFRKRN